MKGTGKEGTGGIGVGAETEAGGMTVRTGIGIITREETMGKVAGGGVVAQKKMKSHWNEEHCFQNVAQPSNLSRDLHPKSKSQVLRR